MGKWLEAVGLLKIPPPSLAQLMGRIRTEAGLANTLRVVKETLLIGRLEATNRHNASRLLETMRRAAMATCWAQGAAGCSSKALAGSIMEEESIPGANLILK